MSVEGCRPVDGLELRHSSGQLFRVYLWHDTSILTDVVGLVFGIVFLSIGLIFLWAEIPFWLHGVPTKGTVTGKFLTLSSVIPTRAGMVLAHGTGPKSFVRYRYQDKHGAILNGQGQVNHWKWKSIRPGDMIDICYLENAPATNRPAEGRWEVSIAFLFPLIGIVFATSSGIRIRQRLRWIREQIAVIKSGRAASALIDRCVERSQGRRRPNVCDVDYRYLVVGGSESPMVLAGKQTMSLKLGRELQAGTLVVVIFDPTNPVRHALDLFRARLDIPADKGSWV